MLAPDRLSLAEELLLIALDDETGRLIGSGAAASTLDRALAAALLMELTLASRLDSDTEKLFVLSTQPLGSPLLDEVLAQIAAAPQTQRSSVWVQQISVRGPEMRERLITQLVERGILQRAEQRLLWMFSRRAYPPTSGREEQEVRTRIIGLLNGQDIPEPRDALLIGLIEAAGLIRELLDPPTLERLRPRILALAQLEELNRSVRHTVSGLQRGVGFSQS